MSENIKTFLNDWALKNFKITPNYKVNALEEDSKEFCGYRCEFALKGFDYVGIGISKNENESRNCAAKDFTRFLLKKGLIRKDMIPKYIDLVDLYNDKVRDYEFPKEVTPPDLETNSVTLGVHKSEKAPIFRINFDPEVKKTINDLITCFGLKVIEKPIKMPFGDEFEMISNQITENIKASPNPSCPPMNWLPPVSNWNPWKSCIINNNEKEILSIDDMSIQMKNTFIARRERDPERRKILQERENLLISPHVNQIIEAVSNNQIVMIRGDTGSGKSTQVPQFILDHFIQETKGAQCNIVVTQPWRITALTLAERVSRERGELLGESCGFSVPLEDVLPRSHGSILYCTVGSLLRKFEYGFAGISHIIVDEVHKRDCNTDLLLIVLRDLAATHPNLKVLLLTCVADIGIFTKYFPSLFCIDIPSRSHPVTHYFLEDVIEFLNFTPERAGNTDKKRYIDFYEEQQEEISGSDIEDEEEINCNNICHQSYQTNTKIALSKLSEKKVSLDLLEDLLRFIEGVHPDGAVLIFLPGWNTIQILLKYLQQHPFFGSNRFVLLTLHSNMTHEEASKVTGNSYIGSRKIVLTTDIAESSLTISNIMFVIDACRTEVKTFNYHTNITTYNTVYASKTNLSLRRACAGLVREGYVFHMCSRERYNLLETNETPEIHTTSIHEIVLLIKLLRLGDVKTVLNKSIDRPPLVANFEAQQLLKEMKAFNQNNEITPLGSILARFPFNPRLGKMIIYGCLFGIGDACATIAACKSVGNPFVSFSGEHKDVVDDRCSDHIAIVNVFQKLQYSMAESNFYIEQFCYSNGLDFSLIKKSLEAISVIKGILKNAGFPARCYSPYPSLDNVVTLVITGLYPNVCYHKERIKVFARDGKLGQIHKSSVNGRKVSANFQSPLFIYGEKLFAETIYFKELSMINPIQLLMFGSVKVTYQDNNVVIDEWLRLDADFDLVAKIIALRPALENLLIKICDEPDFVLTPHPKELLLLDFVTKLSDPNICRHSANGFDRMVGDKRKRKASEEPQFNHATKRLISNDSTRTIAENNIQCHQKADLKPNNLLKKTVDKSTSSDLAAIGMAYLDNSDAISGPKEPIVSDGNFNRSEVLKVEQVTLVHNSEMKNVNTCQLLSKDNHMKYSVPNGIGQPLFRSNVLNNVVLPLNNHFVNKDSKTVLLRRSLPGMPLTKSDQASFPRSNKAGVKIEALSDNTAAKYCHNNKTSVYNVKKPLIEPTSNSCNNRLLVSSKECSQAKISNTKQPVLEPPTKGCYKTVTSQSTENINKQPPSVDVASKYNPNNNEKNYEKRHIVEENLKVANMRNVTLKRDFNYANKETSSKNMEMTNENRNIKSTLPISKNSPNKKVKPISNHFVSFGRSKGTLNDHARSISNSLGISCHVPDSQSKHIQIKSVLTENESKSLTNSDPIPTENSITKDCKSLSKPKVVNKFLKSNLCNKSKLLISHKAIAKKDCASPISNDSGISECAPMVCKSETSKGGKVVNKFIKSNKIFPKSSPQKRISDKTHETIINTGEEVPNKISAQNDSAVTLVGKVKSKIAAKPDSTKLQKNDSCPKDEYGYPIPQPRGKYSNCRPPYQPSRFSLNIVTDNVDYEYEDVVATCGVTTFSRRGYVSKRNCDRHYRGGVVRDYRGEDFD